MANAINELPEDRRRRFEVDKESGLFKLDHYLFSSSQYPGDYGLVSGTLAEVDEALDAWVTVSEATFAGILMETRIMELLRMNDGGNRRERILECDSPEVPQFGYPRSPCHVSIDSQRHGLLRPV